MNVEHIDLMMKTMHVHHHQNRLTNEVAYHLHLFLCHGLPLHHRLLIRPVDTGSSLSLIHWSAYFHQASIDSKNFIALNKKQEQVVSSNLEVYASLSGVLFFLFVISSLCIARLWLLRHNLFIALVAFRIGDKI